MQLADLLEKKMETVSHPTSPCQLPHDEPPTSHWPYMFEVKNQQKRDVLAKGSDHVF